MLVVLSVILVSFFIGDSLALALNSLWFFPYFVSQAVFLYKLVKTAIFIPWVTKFGASGKVCGVCGVKRGV